MLHPHGCLSSRPGKGGREGFLPCLKMMLQIAALQHLGAVLCERAVDQQLVEKLVDQDAGFLAMLQNHGLSVHRAEVFLHQEVGEAQGTIGVSARSVQRVQQCLQADVTYEVVIYIFCVRVEVVFLWRMVLATHYAQRLGTGIWVGRKIWLVHG